VDSRAATATAALDRPRPAKDRAQKGTTWARTERGPAVAQTQRRLSSNEGTVPNAVAATLANTGARPSGPARRPSTSRLTEVETADTDA
jgi:hypothetical protein